MRQMHGGGLAATWWHEDHLGARFAVKMESVRMGAMEVGRRHVRGVIFGITTRQLSDLLLTGPTISFSKKKKLHHLISQRVTSLAGMAFYLVVNSTVRASLTTCCWIYCGFSEF